jgi:enoyl-CoA hydratase
MSGDEPAVRVERRGHLGLITLNRPKSINALTHPMVRSVLDALAAWANDEAVAVIAITGAGERGLCAGGDIVALYNSALSAKDGGDGSAACAFWADEYRMNLTLSRYRKPIVALQDGLVLGGGIGISAHCSHRVVTERSKLGLPEVGIGYTPDVGATWLLARAPGRLGAAAALTGGMVGAGDAIVLGLSDVYVPSASLPQLLTALETHAPDDALALVAEPAPSGALAAERVWIDVAFAGDDPAAIVARVRAQAAAASSSAHTAAREGVAAAAAPGPTPSLAAEFAAAFGRVSPTGVAVTLRALHSSATASSLADVLRQDYRVSAHAIRTREFIEGIRAQVIDKDRNPRWEPATHEAVSAAIVDPYFAVPATGDLHLAL